MLSNNVMFMTSSGGNGHIQASIAMTNRVIQERTGTPVHKINVLDHTLGSVGKKFAETWNNAQKKGDLEKQVKLIKYQPWAEALFSPFVFWHVFYAIFKYDVNEIVDTQGLWTVSTVRAVRFANFLNKLRRKKRKIQVKKIFIECPSNTKNYCFDSVKKLSRKDRKIFTLYSIEPNIKTREEECNYWKKACKLSIEKNEVVYIEPPIRNIFLQYKITNPPLPNSLSFKINTDDELTILRSLYHDLNLIEKNDPEKRLIELPIRQDDLVMTLMLGSQAAEKSTLKYISSSLELARSPEMQNKTLYFFVFCNKHDPGTNSLFKKVTDKIKAEGTEFPPNIKIIPLTFQDAEEIAPMIYRSDIAITRTGAQATQETMSVARKQILIHSEIHEESREFSQEDLLKGIPLWEKGNAYYLMEKKNAKVTNPSLFKKLALEALQEAGTSGRHTHQDI